MKYVRIDVLELWEEFFKDLPAPDQSWEDLWNRYQPEIVLQAFTEIERWRARHPEADTFSIAKMITARCRLIATGERKLRVTLGVS